MSSNLFQILQLLISGSTPIAVCFFGYKMTKTMERRKLDVLKEKEW